LKALALKLLGQPTSSSSCERNWSTYGFINSALRNRLTPPHAEDLVFVHNNMHLLSRKSEDYNKGLTQMWDVGVDNHETLLVLAFLNMLISQWMSQNLKG